MSRVAGLWILVVDQDDVDRQLVGKLLENAGCRVQLATLEEVPWRLQQHAYDAVFMDAALALPSGPPPRPRRVLLSRGETDHGQPADARLTKPIDARSLGQTLQALFPAHGFNSSAPASAEMREPSALLDLPAALQHVGGDMTILSELAALFLSGCPEMMARIEEAVARRACEDVEDSAHRFKSAVSNFFATATVHATQRLMLLGKDRQLEELDQALTELQREMDALRPVLQALVDKPAQSPS